MPFPDHGGLIAGFFQELGKRLLIAIEAISVCHEAVNVAVFSSQNDCSAWAANRVGAEAVFEQHAVSCNFVDVRCRVDIFQPTLVSTDGMWCMIVGEDE